MSKKYIFTEEEMQKIAMLIASSGKLLNQTTKISRDLLHDNEDLQEKVAEYEDEKREAVKKRVIEKIAGIMQEKGLVSKTAIPGKVAELEKMSNETLLQLENTFDGLNGSTPAEKHAEEGFTTMEFMADINVNEKSVDGRPGPMSF